LLAQDAHIIIKIPV